MIQKKCLICEKTFYIKPCILKAGYGKYCSHKCYGESQKNKLIQICLICKKTFYTKPSVLKIGQGKYCSRKCSWRSQNKKQFLVCATCKKEFKVSPSGYKRKYCSRKCYWQSKKGKLAHNNKQILIICAICKKEFKVFPSGYKRKYCSHKCFGQSKTDKFTQSIVQKKCPTCNTIFINKRHPNVIHCSRKCAGKARQQKITRQCFTCKKTIEVHKHEIKERNYCSKKCFYKFQRQHPCKRNQHPAWKGGRIAYNGYIITSKPEHPFANKMGYVREHRLIYEQKLGRYLKRHEVIHHINGNKTDNRIENLMYFPTVSAHTKHHHALRKAKQAQVLDCRSPEPLLI